MRITSVRQQKYNSDPEILVPSSPDEDTEVPSFGFGGLVFHLPVCHLCVRVRVRVHVHAHDTHVAFRGHGSEMVSSLYVGSWGLYSGR